MLHDNLTGEVGLELATLLRAARANNGVVVRPAPVLRASLENEGEVDLGTFGDVLADMHSVLTALKGLGAIDYATEEAAGRYFKIQDKGWPVPPRLSPTQPIYLDSLALTYLQYVNLLEVVLANFESVFIDASTEEEALALLDTAKNADEALHVINDIRSEAHKAYMSEKLIFGPVRRKIHRNDHEPDAGGSSPQSSTLNLISNLMNADAVAIDDRFINKEAFVVTSPGQRTRLVCSLDIIQDLTERGVISESERRTFRHRLRMAGAALVPIDTEELIEAALRSAPNESAELREFRCNMGLARIAEVPCFPSEIPWLITVNTSVRNAILQVWAREDDASRATQIGEALLDVVPRPDEWIERWDGMPPPDWCKAVSSITVAGLAISLEVTAKETEAAYNNWLEDRILLPLRNSSPEQYKRVVEQVRSLILEDSRVKYSRSQKLLRLQALLILNRLPETLRSEVLSDGRVATRYDLKTNRPIHLVDQWAVSRESLFAAFRDAATHSASQNLSLVDENGNKSNSKVWIANDDSGIVEIGNHRLRFRHAALLMKKIKRRRAVVQRTLSRTTLANQYLREVVRLVNKRVLSHDNFLDAVNLLSSSPERFTDRLAEAVNRKAVTVGDLVPDDVRHWENLTAERARSVELHEFVEDELKQERLARIKRNPAQGFRSISLTFAALELVPHDLLRQMDVDSVLRMIKGIADVDDPFALVGSFEICADWVSKDPRFIELGENILESLFADTNRLQRNCGIFAAVFVASTAELATHEVTSRQPAYWRRLAAASHAALAVRTLRDSAIDHEQFLSWVMGKEGVKYMLSVYRDTAAEPRWRPEWATAKFLAADVFGRANAAVASLKAQHAPKSWLEAIETCQKWIDENNLSLVTTLPSVLQGARSVRAQDVYQSSSQLAEIWREIEKDQSVESLLRVAPLFYCFGIPPGAVPFVATVMRKMQDGTDNLDNGKMQAATAIATHAAVLASDTGLSDFIASTCIEKANGVTTDQAIQTIVFRLVECIAASKDRTNALRELAKRLEILAFNLPMGELSNELMRLLRGLVCVEPEIAPLLGRAIQAASLAASRFSS